MRKRIRYSGARFGRLVLIDKHSYFDGKNYVYKWRCKCDCGNEKFVNETALQLVGGTRSCGCKRLKHGEILPGTTFDCLTVIKVSDKRTDRNLLQYKCKCKCGEVVTIPRTYLLSNRSQKSCGCHKTNRNRKPQFKGTINDFLFVSEAADEYGVTFTAVKERIKHAKKSGKIDELEEKGLIKQYITAGASRGHWLITRKLMDIWFG